MFPRIDTPTLAFGLVLVACSPATQAPADQPSVVAVGGDQAPPGEPAAGDAPAPPTDLAVAARELKCEERDEAWGCVDAAGNVVLAFEHLSISPFSPAGIAVVMRQDGVCQYVDATGKVLYEAFNFDNGPDPLSDGRARFVQGGKIGFVDENYEIVIPAQYDSAYYFDEGKAKVCVGCDPRIWKKDAPDGLREGRVFYIDRQGNEVADP